MAGMFGWLPPSQRQAIKLAYNNPNTPPAVIADLERWDGSGGVGGLSSQSLAYLKSVANAGVPYGGTIDQNTGLINIDPASGGYYGNAPYIQSDVQALGLANAGMGYLGQLANANAALGSSYYGALGNVQAAQAMADAQKMGYDLNSAANRYATDGSVKIAGLNNDAIKNVKTQDVEQNLDPNGPYATQLKASLAQSAAQYGAAVDPKKLQIQALMALLGGGGTSGGGIGTGLSAGLGNPLAGALGSLGVGTGTGSGTGTGTGTGGGVTTVAGTGANGETNVQPPLPQFQSFNDLALQRKMGQQAATISKGYDTNANNFKSSLGQRGFSMNSPGAQFALASFGNQKLGDIMNSQRDLQQNAMEYNAQNALPYAQTGLSQYNANANRAQQSYLAQLAANRGTLNALLA